MLNLPKKIFFLALIILNISNAATRWPVFNYNHLVQEMTQFSSQDIQDAHEILSDDYLGCTLLLPELKNLVWDYYGWEKYIETPVDKIAIQPSSNLAAIAYSGVIQVWWLPVKKIVFSININDPNWDTFRITAISFCQFSDSDKLAFATNRGEITIYHLKKDAVTEVVASVKTNCLSIDSIAFAGNETSIYFRDSNQIYKYQYAKRHIHTPLDQFFPWDERVFVDGIFSDDSDIKDLINNPITETDDKRYKVEGSTIYKNCGINSKYDLKLMELEKAKGEKIEKELAQEEAKKANRCNFFDNCIIS